MVSSIIGMVWNNYILCRYGKNLASCFLQRIKSCSRRPPSFVDWSTNESKIKQRKDDTNFIRNIQCSIILCCYLSCVITLCFRKNNWYCCWFWRWCLTHSPNLWRLCTPISYSQNWFSRKSLHKLFG